MDKQLEESNPKKQEEILSLCGAAISVKYAEQDDPEICYNYTIKCTLKIK